MLPLQPFDTFILPIIKVLTFLNVSPFAAKKEEAPLPLVFSQVISHPLLLKRASFITLSLFIYNPPKPPGSPVGEGREQVITFAANR